MKIVMTTISVVLLLSTLTWVAMYYEFPHAPLTGPETALIVFLFAVLAASVQAIIKRCQNRNRKEAIEPPK